MEKKEKNQADYNLCTSNPPCVPVQARSTVLPEDRLLCKQLSGYSTVPRRARLGEAGFDLFACLKNDHEQRTITIPPHQKASIPTGIAVSCPPNIVYQINPRSGHADKAAIDTLAGVIDSTYRGELKVILQNHGSKDFIVNHGDKIAQMLPLQLANFHGIELELAKELDTTERGDQGFGSTDQPKPPQVTEN
jgi:dUTP pyrophosphatase